MVFKKICVLFTIKLNALLGNCKCFFYPAGWCLNWTHGGGVRQLSEHSFPINVALVLPRAEALGRILARRRWLSGHVVLASSWFFSPSHSSRTSHKNAFLHQICTEWIWCKSNFSCSVIPRDSWKHWNLLRFISSDQVRKKIFGNLTFKILNLSKVM